MKLVKKGTVVLKELCPYFLYLLLKLDIDLSEILIEKILETHLHSYSKAGERGESFTNCIFKDINRIKSYLNIRTT